MSEEPNRLDAGAAHGYGGIALDRSKPLSFRVEGIKVTGFAGDTILSALLANGIIGAGSEDGSELGLDERFSPPVMAARASERSGTALPMERTPAIDGLDLVTVGAQASGLGDRLLRRKPVSLAHRFQGAPPLQPWLRLAPAETVEADLVIVGGGVAGLSAAALAGSTGKKVILVERRPWLGGDARYFGPVGNDETPEAIEARLIARLNGLPSVTLWTGTEAFDIAGGAVLVHRVEMKDGRPEARVIRVITQDTILATGSVQRLPVFSGNRLPGIVGSAAAYHRAKRHGVWRGRHALIVTQSNFAYRLALRIHDAGVSIGRIVDTRLNPHSRFVDFAKATGFTLSSELVPVEVSRSEGDLALRVRGGGGAEQVIRASKGQIVVSGGWQPDLWLWMRASGAIGWNPESGLLEPRGHIDHMVLAGSVAGCLTTKGAIESGRAAAARLLGLPEVAVDDTGIDTAFETPDAPTPVAPTVPGRAYLDGGLSLISRRATEGTTNAAPASPLDDARPMSLGDVAASVQAKLIEPEDAGTIAEERGTAGGAIAMSDWKPNAPEATSAGPGYLEGRFGPDPMRAVVIVDDHRQFETGALIYSNLDEPLPGNALGVVIGPAPGSHNGGFALLSRARLASVDRFVIVTARGPAPVRVAERLDEEAVL